MTAPTPIPEPDGLPGTVGGALPSDPIAQSKSHGEVMQADRWSGGAIRLVPVYVRVLWLIGWLTSLGLAPSLVILAGTTRTGHSDVSVAAAVGSIGSCILSILCFVMIFRDVFAGWYRYLIRPVLLTVCIQIIVTAAMGSDWTNPANGNMALAMFLMIFPTIVFFAVLFLPARILGALDIRPFVARKNVRHGLGRWVWLAGCLGTQVEIGLVIGSWSDTALNESWLWFGMPVDQLSFSFLFATACFVASFLYFIMVFMPTSSEWYRLFAWELMGLSVAITVVAVGLGDSLHSPGFFFFLLFGGTQFVVLLLTWLGAIYLEVVRKSELRAAAALSGRVSPRKQLWALILAVVGFVPGLAGWHRFYVGKIHSGAFWLRTLGWLGIGTLVDTILIVLGRFEDKNALRLVIWYGPRVDSHGSVESVSVTWDPTDDCFTALGNTAAWLVPFMIVLAMLAISAGALDHVSPVCAVIMVNLVFLLPFISVIFIMIGRRRYGPMHLVRAIVGLGGFFGGMEVYWVGVLWTASVHEVDTAPDTLFRAFGHEPAILALSGVIIALISVLILSWPPRKRAPVFAPMPHQGVVL